MLLRQPEYLVALARERHFARAADGSHVSQPSLSAAIRKLEHELGAPIARRGRRLEGRRDAAHDPVLRTPPHARVSLESPPSREITRRLAEYELDIARTYVDDEELSTVRTYPLHEERYLLLTPRDGELAGRERVRWAEVATVPLCLLGQQMRNRRIPSSRGRCSR
ncbi:LysR family transcriptional regulator [Amycolatopsis carbonis]|uniref:LysR family transcriptional regulator n=1 Tax=Amycolatopsis carbonis TaxID=715471 RepID=A0A9Y2MT02_9PSEU|nr:LysR family transcriptional regulator [Amycolatopsis sp. 2-15]WIX76373.1 LysR family transcriptional regulator [Amycolatopsis sp. 2-15]